MTTRTDPARTARIAELNDLTRTALGVGGRFYQTAGVNALDPQVQSRLREALEKHNDWPASADPYGEHDFGEITLDGERFFWKIDYYDKACEYGSEDPADPWVTTRVLTLMRAEEY
jgi:hypothetical protein